MSSICILDYGSGNVKSVFNLFSGLSQRVVISNDPVEIEKATHIILPGVGSFGAAMRKIQEKLPIGDLKRAVIDKKTPFLGICVGMQVLATSGMEFGEYPGLGWVEGVVKKIDTADLPTLHIGWNGVRSKRASPLLQGLEDNPDFYFVHSYAARLVNEHHTVATTNYGSDFCSVLQHDNIYGVQFHPEKSQRAGIKLAKNFLLLQ